MGMQIIENSVEDYRDRDTIAEIIMNVLTKFIVCISEFSYQNTIIMLSPTCYGVSSSQMLSIKFPSELL